MTNFVSVFPEVKKHVEVLRMMHFTTGAFQIRKSTKYNHILS